MQEAELGASGHVRTGSAVPRSAFAMNDSPNRRATFGYSMGFGRRVRGVSPATVLDLAQAGLCVLWESCRSF